MKVHDMYGLHLDGSSFEKKIAFKTWQTAKLWGKIKLKNLTITAWNSKVSSFSFISIQFWFTHSESKHQAHSNPDIKSSGCSAYIADIWLFYSEYENRS